MLSLHFLGAPRVNRGGQVLKLPPSKKTRALLAYLAITGKPHRRERLCTLFWEIPDDPRGALRWSLSRIRDLVDEPGIVRVVANHETVRFEAHDARVDVLDLRQVSDALPSEISTERLSAVVSGIDGEFLEGEDLRECYAFHAWCVAEREEARAAQTRVLWALVDRLKSEPEQALSHARTLVELQPDREEPWATLVDLLANAGRSREAKEQSELGRRVLQDAGTPASDALLRKWGNLHRKRTGKGSQTGDTVASTMSEINKFDELEATALLKPAEEFPSSLAAALPPNPPQTAKPTIVILPFSNLSNDPLQDSFADGLTEDLITDLSRNGGLFVIARHSAFFYKGKSFDVSQISKDLGVRYVLEGSARHAAGRVRINVKLIDAAAGEHLWGERFDRTLEDVFAVQDEVSSKIVEALVGRLAVPTLRRRPRNLEAFDLCVRARVLTEETPQTAREACLLLKRSIELEPGYAEAHGLMAYNRWLAWTHFGEPEEVNRALAVELARKAVELDPNDAGCRYFLGTILAYEKRWQESDAEFGLALELDPNHADTWAALSDMSVLGGHVTRGLEQIEKAFLLNPYPAVWYFCHLGQAQYASRDYESAIKTLVTEETYRTNSRKFLAASLAQIGRVDEARREAEMFLVTHPYFTISHWAASQPLRDAATRDHFLDGFRRAGLPE
ncbi:MAG: hypothetical protein ACRECW_03110 [Phyllobacterium sp.]